METTLDLSRWKEKPNGVAYRRWVILSTGLRQVLGNRFSRLVLLFSWVVGVLAAAFIFCFSQSVATGGWLETWAANFGVRAAAVAKGLGALVLLYPDICIRALYTSIFWLQSFMGLWLSLLALTTILPQLITRDRASNALTIYLSRPLTSTDYLLGKLGIIVGVILLFWTGPLLCGWLLSLAVAPNRDFILYSLSPLSHALLFNLVGLVTLSSIALGVSAVTKNSRSAGVLWFGLWIVAAVVADLPHTPEWIRRASFTRDLFEVRQQVFRLDSALLEAVDTLPFIGHDFARNLAQAGQKAAPTDPAGAAAGLTVLVLLSSAVFFRKLRPE